MKKIVFWILGLILIAFLVFIIGILYSQVQRLNNKPNPPILYELNFDNKSIVGNTSEENDRWSGLPDPMIIGLAITGIDTNNIKGITWLIKDFNSNELLESEYSNGFQSIKHFSLPKIPKEWLLEAEIEYYNGNIIKSADYFSGPVLTIWPDYSRPDIPLVSLKIDKGIIKVGEEVKFEAIAKTLSNDPEFEANRVFEWDFDGDGTWDLTTGANEVQHIYTIPSEYGYKPRVAVLYKGYKGISIGRNIIVQGTATNQSDKELTGTENVNININTSVIAAQGGNEYDVAKAKILSILPIHLATDVSALFGDFESIHDDIYKEDKRKQVLQEIINTIKKNITPKGEIINKNQIDEIDMNTVIMPNICKIITFYNINITNNVCSN